MTCHSLDLIEGGREEGRDRPFYTLEELVSRLDPELGDGGRRLLVHALESMRASIRSFMREFRKQSRELYGYSLELDCPPPEVVGGKVYPGFWVGVYEYREGSEGPCIRVVVHPHLKGYSLMMGEVTSTLMGLYGFRPLIYSLAAGSPTLMVLEYIRMVALEALLLAERETRFIVRSRVSDTGAILRPKVGPAGLEAYLLDVSREPNRQLMSAIAAAVRAVSRALSSISSLVEESKESSGSRAQGFWALADNLIGELRGSLRALLDEPFVKLSLTQPTTDDPGRYAYLVQASRALSQGLAPSPRGGVKARLFLYPSTKLYELYAFATLVSDLVRHGYELVSSAPLKPLEVEMTRSGAGSVRAYYNHYPGKLSRLIKPLTGRVPKPDMLVHQGEPSRAAVVAEVKYRYLDGRRVRRLHLSDALRLAAYLLDAARDTRLAAILVALSKPPAEEVDRIRRRIKPINGKKVDVAFLELNPDGGREDFVAALKDLVGGLAA